MTAAEVWRPWEPRPGDHVRVHVSGECGYCLDPRYPAGHEAVLANDGRTGTVYEVGHEVCGRVCGEADGEGHLAHEVWIKWDAPRWYDDRCGVGMWMDPALSGLPFDDHFAIAELALVERAVDGGRT